jgi:hypothetical protein
MRSSSLRLIPDLGRGRSLAGPLYPDFAGIVVLACLHQVRCHRHHFAHDGHQSGHFLSPRPARC